MVRILFLCHGNICRSPMAEFVMKDLVRKAGLGNEILIESAALHTDEIGSDIHGGTKRVLDAHHVQYRKRSAHLTDAFDYEKFDYIVGMDRENMRDMEIVFNGDPDSKCSLLLDWADTPGIVDDPWYTGDFETTYNQVVSGCEGLLNHIDD